MSEPPPPPSRSSDDTPVPAPTVHNLWETEWQPGAGAAGPQHPASSGPPPNFSGALLLGAGAANLVGIALMALSRALTIVSPQTSGALVFSVFILIPLVMGIVSAFFWRRLELGTGQYLVFSLLTSGVGIALSYFVLREGVVCLVIVSPLILAFVFSGALIGRALFRPGPPNALRLCLAPLLLAVWVADCLSPHHHRNVVTTRVVVRARPETVWPYLTQFPPIPAGRDAFWLNRLGLPRPERTTATAPVVGAARRCVFSGNLVFEERITELVPNKRITFTIVRQPAHPEILGHATLRRGQMTLESNGDGTTTIVGKSWYSLHVYPAWYYDRWAEHIGHAVHARVMNHIGALAEADEKRRTAAVLPPHRP